MTDNPESAGTAQEPNGTPNPQASQQPPVSSTSGSPDVGTLVSAILSHPDFQKQTQSVKDKRIADIQKDLDEKDQQIARLAKALNVDPQQVQQAQRQIAIEDMVNAYQNGTLIPQRQVPSQTSPGSGVDLAQVHDMLLQSVGVAQLHGLDDHLATLDWSNPVSATLEAQAWVKQNANQTQPTAADRAPASQGLPATAMSSLTSDQLGDELLKLQQDPRKNKARIAEITAELERRDK